MHFKMEVIAPQCSSQCTAGIQTCQEASRNFSVKTSLTPEICPLQLRCSLFTQVEATRSKTNRNHAHRIFPAKLTGFSTARPESSLCFENSTLRLWNRTDKICRRE